MSGIKTDLRDLGKSFEKLKAQLKEAPTSREVQIREMQKQYLAAGLHPISARILAERKTGRP